MAARELDERDIPGNGGTVKIVVEGRDRFIVTAKLNGIEEIVPVYDGDDVIRAFDAFRHTFMLEHVPDVFKGGTPAK